MVAKRSIRIGSARAVVVSVQQHQQPVRQQLELLQRLLRQPCPGQDAPESEMRIPNGIERLPVRRRSRSTHGCA
jgi:hypothetical protein